MPSLTSPVVLTRRYWTAKRLAILIGFVLTILGSLVPISTSIRCRSERMARPAIKRPVAKIDTLKNAQAQYLLFQQQTSLVYALNSVDSPRRRAGANADLQSLPAVAA